MNVWADRLRATETYQALVAARDLCGEVAEAELPTPAGDETQILARVAAVTAHLADRIEQADPLLVSVTQVNSASGVATAIGDELRAFLTDHDPQHLTNAGDRADVLLQGFSSVTEATGASSAPDVSALITPLEIAISAAARRSEAAKDAAIAAIDSRAAEVQSSLSTISSEAATQRRETESQLQTRLTELQGQFEAAIRDFEVAAAARGEELTTAEANRQTRFNELASQWDAQSATLDREAAERQTQSEADRAAREERFTSELTQATSLVAEIRAEVDRLTSDAEARHNDVRTRTDAVKARLDELASAAEQREQAFGNRAGEFESTIGSHVARLDAAISAQDEQFASAENARSEHFATLEAQWSERDAAQMAETKERTEQYEADRLRRTEQFGEELRTTQEKLGSFVREATDSFAVMRAERETDLDSLLNRARRVLGTTAAAAVYGSFDQEAREQRQEANTYRTLATRVLIFTALFLLALFAFDSCRVHEPYSSGWDVLGRNSSRTVLLGVLIGGAAYAARQSGHHRKREQSARQLANELAVLFPFMADLPKETQDALLTALAPRVFRGSTAADDGPGPHEIGVGGVSVSDVVSRLLGRHPPAS